MLDTNMCIYLMKHHPPEVAPRFAQCYVGEVVISAITPAELEYGVACSGDRETQNCAALSLLLIAAHAVALDVVLVTNNQADFAGYPGVRVENWVCAGPGAHLPPDCWTGPRPADRGGCPLRTLLEGFRVPG